MILPVLMRSEEDAFHYVIMTTIEVSIRREA